MGRQVDATVAAASQRRRSSLPGTTNKLGALDPCKYVLGPRSLGRSDCRHY